MSRLYLTILSCLVSVITFSNNLFSEAGFENGEKGKWITFGGVVSSFDTTSKDARSGIYSLRTVIDTPRAIIRNSEKVIFQQSETYKVSFYAKVELNTLAIQASSKLTTAPNTLFNTSGNKANFIITDQWQQFSFESKANTVNIGDSVYALIIEATESGILYIDDVSVELIQASNEPHTEICNNSFESNLDFWTPSINDGANASIIFENTTIQEGNGAVKIKVNETPQQSYNIQLQSCTTDSREGQRYKISFWGKSDSEMGLIKAQSKFADVGATIVSEEFELSSTWNQFSWIVTAPSTVSDNFIPVRFQFHTAGTFYIDNVSIEEIDALPTVCNGDFESGLNSWVTTQNSGTSEIELTSTTSYSGGQSAKVEITDLGGKTSDIQLSSCKSDIKENTTYSILFYAKTENNEASLISKTSLAYAPFTNYAADTFLVNSNWRKLAYTFTAPETKTDSVRLIKLQFLNEAIYFIDSISIVEGIVESQPYEPVGLSNDYLDNSTSIFPNPSSDYINIKVDSKIQIESVLISDIKGKILVSTKNPKIDISNLKSGFYIVQIISDKGITSKNLTIK